MNGLSRVVMKGNVRPTLTLEDGERVERAGLLLQDGRGKCPVVLLVAPAKAALVVDALDPLIPGLIFNR